MGRVLQAHLQGEPLQLRFQQLLVFLQTTPLLRQLLNLQPAGRTTDHDGTALPPAGAGGAPSGERGKARGQLQRSLHEWAFTNLT